SPSPVLSEWYCSRCLSTGSQATAGRAETPERHACLSICAALMALTCRRGRRLLIVPIEATAYDCCLGPRSQSSEAVPCYPSMERLAGRRLKTARRALSFQFIIAGTFRAWSGGRVILVPLL